MVDTLHLGLTSALALIGGVLFTWVGVLVFRRRRDPSVRLANLSLAAGWGLLGVEALSDGLRVATGVLGDPNATLYVALAFVKIWAAALLIAALGHYVTFLHTGRHAPAIPLVALGVLHGIVFTVLTWHRLPATVVVGTWSTRLVLHGESLLGPGWLMTGIILFFLPPLFLSVAYLMLLPRLPERTLKLRVVLVTIAIGVFTLASMVQSNPEASTDTPAVPLVTGLMALSGALAYVSYRPPAVLARSLGITDVRDEARGTPGP